MISRTNIRTVLWFCTIVRRRPAGLENPHAVLKSLQRTLAEWRQT